jgi:outer membrane protein TolC
VLQKQAAKITAELKVSTARTTLRQLLELPETEEFDVSAPEINMNNPDSLPPLPEYGELQARIRAAHPGLKSDSISVKAAQKNTKVAGKNSSISVTLGANSSTGLQAWESKGYKDQLKYGWQNSLTLGISIPIIDAGATANKVLLAHEFLQRFRPQTRRQRLGSGGGGVKKGHLFHVGPPGLIILYATASGYFTTATSVRACLAFLTIFSRFSVTSPL